MGRGVSFGGHERATVTGETDDWLTPPEIIAALGLFDLDPATPREMPWATAERRYTVDDDGLSQPWSGRVWLNPPYGRYAWRWVDRLAKHGDGIALLFARTDTEWFASSVWDKADALLFVSGRVRFHRGTGEPIRRTTSGGSGSGAPSVLVAFGIRNAVALADSGIKGSLVTLWQPIQIGDAGAPSPVTAEVGP